MRSTLAIIGGLLTGWLLVWQSSALPDPYAPPAVLEFIDEHDGAITALFTVVLALSTIFLWRSTREAALAAKESADAARDSAVAAIATETARFYIVVEETNFDSLIGRIGPNWSPSLTQDTQSLDTPIRVRYRFKNYGKTPGIIKAMCLEARIAAEPVDALHTVLIDATQENMIAGGDTTPTNDYLSFEPPLVGQIRAVERNNMRIWFYGRLDYLDVFETPHTHRFYFRSITADGRCFLQSYDHKHYNKST